MNKKADKKNKKEKPKNSSENLYLNKDALPETMEVKHLKAFTKWGINQCYDLCNSGKFHVIRNGKKYLINKKSFLQWFHGESVQAASLPELEAAWKKLFDNITNSIIMQPHLT